MVRIFMEFQIKMKWFNAASSIVQMGNGFTVTALIMNRKKKMTGTAVLHVKEQKIPYTAVVKN